MAKFKKQEGFRAWQKRKELEYLEDIELCCFSADTEACHILADIFICDFLKKLGFNRIVKKFLEVKGITKKENSNG